MKYPKIRLLFDRNKRASISKPGLVEVELYFNFRQRRISTGVKVLPSHWDPVRQIVVSCPDALALNMRIEAVRKPIENYIMKLMIDGKPFVLEELVSELQRKPVSGSFREYVEKRINERTDIREITRTSHRSLLFALDAFKRITTFESLTPTMLRAFDRWLKDQGYASTTVGKYHKFLKTYINEAKGEGIIDRNPYDGFRVSKGKPRDRRFLTEDEVAAIAKAEISDPSTVHARDVFLFQCYTGLAYADLAEFDFRKVEENEGGRHTLRGKRHKTGEEYYVVITTAAMEILRKYNYKLPVVSNQKYNAALKALGVITGKHITSHCARHTFATISLNRGIPIEVVARMVGHSNIKTTQIYAHVLDKTVDRAFDVLEKIG